MSKSYHSDSSNLNLKNNLYAPESSQTKRVTAKQNKNRLEKEKPGRSTQAFCDSGAATPKSDACAHPIIPDAAPESSLRKNLIHEGSSHASESPSEFYSTPKKNRSSLKKRNPELSARGNNEIAETNGNRGHDVPSIIPVSANLTSKTNTCHGVSLMSERFLQYVPGPKASYLRRKFPIAFLLLSLIAERVQRTTKSCNGLKVGEAHIGDFSEIGATRQQYRTAVQHLIAANYIEIVETCRTRKKGHQPPNFEGKATRFKKSTTESTTESTTIGTKVKLLNSDIWKINFESSTTESTTESTTIPTTDPFFSNHVLESEKAKNVRKECHKQEANESIRPPLSQKAKGGEKQFAELWATIEALRIDERNCPGGIKQKDLQVWLKTYRSELITIAIMEAQKKDRKSYAAYIQRVLSDKIAEERENREANQKWFAEVTGGSCPKWADIKTQYVKDKYGGETIEFLLPEVTFRELIFSSFDRWEEHQNEKDSLR